MRAPSWENTATLIPVKSTPSVIRTLRQLWHVLTAPPAGIAPELWQALCTDLPLLRHYGTADREALRQLAMTFLRQKRLVGAGGLQVAQDMRLLVAVQACVPVLRLGLRWYDDWSSVILYPEEFLAPHEYLDDDGVVHHETRPLSGEATHHGPVILSWADTLDSVHDWEANLVIHEFAHKLDMRNGVANGMPPLHRDMDRTAWTRAFQHAYDDFCRRVDHGLDLPFDDYADQDPAEFFAVASEAFFLTPAQVRATYPAIYHQLGLFYRQWPAGSA